MTFLLAALQKKHFPDWWLLFHCNINDYSVYPPENLHIQPLQFGPRHIFGKKSLLSSAAWSGSNKNGGEREQEAEV